MLRDLSHNLFTRRQAMQLGVGTLAVAAIGAVSGEPVAAEVLEEERVGHGIGMFWDDVNGGEAGVCIDIYQRGDGSGYLRVASCLSVSEARDAGASPHDPIPDDLGAIVPLPAEVLTALQRALAKG